MEVEEEQTTSTVSAETSVPSSDVQSTVSPVPAVLPSPVQPVIPTVPPSIVPPIAPIPSIPPPTTLRPLAPLPVRPPSIRPPMSQNGEVRSTDSDSDHDDSGPGINKGTGEYEISEESRLVRERQEKAMQELMMKRRAAALAVPTNDMAVRARLRRLGEPITLFGEREMERRDRLRMIMAKLDAEGQLEKLMKAHEDEEAVASAAQEEAEEDLQYPFYTEGSKALLDARVDIAKFSLVRAAARLHRARRRRDDPDEDIDAEMDWALKQAENLVLDCSEIGDDRPLSGCSFSADGKCLATCSLTGAAKLWSMPEVKKISTFKGHTERATDVAYSPVHNHLATASADRTARYWNDQGSLLKTFEGHLDRLARISFHPSGKYLGTASFDKTWRLWDIETGEELLLQEGHSRSVYGLTFHHDGSLAASCGLDSLARVWDLRTGRSILALEGHVKPVLGISFSPNGYHLATGGEDNTCRIWDLRKKKSLYVIPAHSNLISQVKFEPQEGYFLVTASYDMTAKVWSARDFKPVKTLSGHESKVTSLDILGDGRYIATVSHDRTIKLWSSNMTSEQAMDVD
ncbi:U4/U6 small nuclear ribonucleoprotein PRP4-like protein [Neltuma alba]|uniref:U4/U6 small nuclear ribonucleoprotein PRP4-like protein n=1 Tax=Neltuma alba TaxID=207710 RepID=UPI0010A42B26|nr:U4/U6 small nuclear ribonucleoprotein PRP4-like protein [Prosopis alba]XP_028761418.1 U4/U6 small nuclear ribonucleoprotein PRP4-like protein [Prosopis alba]XP_028776538.1 U4/U6 small nuclear ribonucleoprotein PRP4-like protein [Prosopis alba]XP_028776546.1 U4/U6 small nuclear ribonucleoprotein PRP4-like protein [Prosopis alba]